MVWPILERQRFTGQVNTILSFWLIVLVYIILGLLEVDGTARKIKSMPRCHAVRILLAGDADAAEKIRRYMVLQTLISVLPGALV